VDAVAGRVYVADMLKVLYDGACPFCRSYVAYARLRKRVGEVEVIDARERLDLVEDYAAWGHDIDESFIVDTGEEVLTHGAALAFLHAKMAPAYTGLPLLANPRLLAAVYPSLRAARNAALRLLGVPPIRSGQTLQPRTDLEKQPVEPVEHAARGSELS
jgi:predicted DCC family thiol-disulfide oxidoreductase YuxK